MIWPHQNNYFVPRLPVFIAAAIVLIYLLIVWRRQAVANPRQLVRLADIPRVLQLVSATHHNGSFAVLLFGENGKPPARKDALNVQFSIDHGRVGLDWVLLSPANVVARDRVAAFFEERRSPLTMSTMNEVNQLRTEIGDLAALCSDLLRSVFGVTDVQEMELISEGFTWSSAGAPSRVKA
jgi:hypothetical protein